MDKVIQGEIARMCGWDNAIFGYTIYTATNAVEWYVDSYINRRRELNTFTDYASAKAHFDGLESEVGK
jgi:hypothetical protein